MFLFYEHNCLFIHVTMIYMLQIQLYCRFSKKDEPEWQAPYSKKLVFWMINKHQDTCTMYMAMYRYLQISLRIKTNIFLSLLIWFCLLHEEVCLSLMLCFSFICIIWDFPLINPHQSNDSTFWLFSWTKNIFFLNSEWIW